MPKIESTILVSDASEFRSGDKLVVGREVGIEGIFADWDFSDHYVIKNDKSALWVCSGFSFFKDYWGAPFLIGFGLIDRWRLWREYRREVRRRALAG